MQQVKNGLALVASMDRSQHLEKSGKRREVSKGKTITVVTIAARASTPVLPVRPENLRIRRILNHNALDILGVGAEVNHCIGRVNSE